MSRLFTRLLAGCLLSFIGIFFYGTPGMALTLTLDEKSIISLANNPSLLKARGILDEAGRPSLFLELEYANDCLSEAGPEIRIIGVMETLAYILVGQRRNVNGCPDIYSPVKQTVRALLPSNLSDHIIRLVAKPWDGGGLTEIILRKNKSDLPKNYTLVEAREFSRKGNLPAFDVRDIKPFTSQPGYRVTGKLGVKSDCIPDRVKLIVFEVPDHDGTPLFDIVMINAPNSCDVPGTSVAVKIEIGSPQRNSGRNVLFLNATDNSVHLIAR